MVGELCCVKPSADLTNDAVAWSGKLPEAELENGRRRSLNKLTTFDTFDWIGELLREHNAYDTVLVDEWRGDRVRSMLCVSQFMVAQQLDDTFCWNTCNILRGKFDQWSRIGEVLGGLGAGWPGSDGWRWL